MYAAPIDSFCFFDGRVNTVFLISPEMGKASALLNPYRIRFHLALDRMSAPTGFGASSIWRLNIRKDGSKSHWITRRPEA